MSKTAIWIHAVWGTKNRESVLLSELRAGICHHIIQNAQEKDFYVDVVDGYLDHLHCLMVLRPDWSIAKQMQMIKGESANWANKHVLLESKLEWADGYFAASVSMDKRAMVRNYIRHQEVYHRGLSFEEEYAHFIDSLGLDQG